MKTFTLAPPVDHILVNIAIIAQSVYLEIYI